MKHPALLLLLFTTGCATSPYLTDRARDAADIFTVTHGVNFGAKARVGPIHAGLLLGFDSFGLRAGQFDWNYWDQGNFGSVTDFDVTFLSQEEFSVPWLTIARDRGKQLRSGGLCCIALPDYAISPDRPLSARAKIPYYTQVEVAGGFFIVGARAGFNPGELVDFLLGWTTLDIFDDDIGLAAD